MERPPTSKARQPLDPDSAERWKPPDLANCETDLLDEEETEYRVDEEDNEEDVETDEQVGDVPQLPESTMPRFEVIRQPCSERDTATTTGLGQNANSHKDTADRFLLATVLDRCTRKLEHDLREQLRKHKLLLEETLFRELDQFGAQVMSRTSKRISHVSAESPHFRVTVSDTSDEKLVLKSHRHPSPAHANHKEHKGHIGVGEAAHRASVHDVKELCRNKMKQEAQATVAHKADARYKSIAHVLRRPKLSRAMSVLAPRNLIHGTFFNLLSAALIVGNAAFIGFQTHIGIANEFSSRSSEEDSDIKNGFVEICFLAFFTVELILRLIYDRLDFLRGVEWRWNLFDSMIVGLSIIETVAASILTGVGMSFPFLRLIRVVRVLRVLKVLHMIPFFKRLGLMMSSVAASLSALAPAIVLLMLVIYTFGICVMQGITNYLADPEKTLPEDFVATLNVRFGSLRRTMATLFMSITGGLSWVEVMSSLLSIGEAYYLIFMFYVGFVQICVLNIVTGVFVDTVQQMYQPEREEIVERETAKKKAMLANLKGLLSEADEDESGTITWQEFQQFTNDKDIKMYLAAHEIDITQAREIFSLIDTQGTGEVSIDEFVLSFIEFKGTAKGSDVMILRNDIQKMLSRVMPFISESSKTLEDLRLMVQYLSPGYCESDTVLDLLASSHCKGLGALDWKQHQESPRPLET